MALWTRPTSALRWSRRYVGGGSTKTCRAVAEAASELWGSPYGSNQLYGEDLCAAAAQTLGEDHNKAPWN
jgi:hypothetical protein